jgi:hypothetical protein
MYGQIVTAESEDNNRSIFKDRGGEPGEADNGTVTLRSPEGVLQTKMYAHHPEVRAGG